MPAMTKTDDPRPQFLKDIGPSFLGETLFDAIPDTVYFVKDCAGRYVAINHTLVERAGCRSKRDIIGRTATDVFPGPLGQRIADQDLAVVRDGKPIHGELELHLYPDGKEGWCLTWKQPVTTPDGKITGLCGISRDLQQAAHSDPRMGAVSRVLGHIRRNLDAPLRLPELAALADCSVYQLDQRIRGLFGLSAGQYVTRARIELACARLSRTEQAIGQIALDCGYGDQAAFTRQFRKSVGLTPGAYRERHRSGPGAGQ